MPPNQVSGEIVTMFTRKHVAAAGATAALAGALIVGGYASPLAAAFAAPLDAGATIEGVRQATPSASPKPAPKPGQGDRQQLTPEQRAQRQQQAQQAHQQYLNQVAANLGVSPQQLQDALKKARIDGVNRAVAEGKLSQDQANQAIQRINSGQGPQGFGPGGPGGPGGLDGQKPGPGGRAAMHGGMMAAAQVVGLTPEQLREQVKAGKSLAQIAQERNISRNDLKARLATATKQRLDQAVQQGRMTQDQSNQVLARFTASLDTLIDSTPGQRPKRIKPAGQ